MEMARAFNSGPTPQAPTWPFPIFTERPFIRPLSRRGQLHTMMRYVQMNPQRLATKRLKPGFFHVQRDIIIHGRNYDGVGNTMLLMAQSFAPVTFYLYPREDGDASAAARTTPFYHTSR